MNKYRIPKLFGLVILTMITLVSLSFLEVFIYSLFVPDQEQAFYDAHATLTAPWVSGIGGAFVFFLVVRYWARRKLNNLLQLAILYPTCYVIVDLAVLLSFAEVEWGSFIFIFLSANGAKFIGSLSAYKMYREPAVISD